MPEIKKNKITYVLWSTLAGAISFFISKVMIDSILLRLDIYIFGSIIAGALGGLLLGLLLRKAKILGE